jgi:hypothetical protein
VRMAMLRQLVSDIRSPTADWNMRDPMGATDPMEVSELTEIGDLI